MTKEGEGKGRFREADGHEYQRDLEKQASRFLRALEQYEIEADWEKKAIFKGSMSDSLGLMGAAAKEINRDGIRKQFSVIEKDYRTFIEDENMNNLMALREDLINLRSNNKSP